MGLPPLRWAYSGFLHRRCLWQCENWYAVVLLSGTGAGQDLCGLSIDDGCYQVHAVIVVEVGHGERRHEVSAAAWSGRELKEVAGEGAAALPIEGVQTIAARVQRVKIGVSCAMPGQTTSQDRLQHPNHSSEHGPCINR